MAVLDNRPNFSTTDERVIESLAESNGTPVEHVRALYEEVHSKLQNDARVKTFVSVIATRLVRNVLQHERSSTDN